MNRIIKFWPFLIVIITVFILQNKNINQYPIHKHSWAQADHYAIAKGFLNNGMNFFKPETYVMNQQFPSKFNVPNETSITAADFPIHNYIPALVMKGLNNTNPIIYRLYILFYSLLGLFFFYRIALLVSKNELHAGFITIFATTSSVYTYYQAGFLPTIPSISNVIIGFYFYLKYIESKNHKLFLISISFLTLAALARTPFNIFLITIFCDEILKVFKTKVIKWKIFATILLAFTLIIFYYLYNRYLLNAYGSIFLNKPLPPNNIAHAKELIFFSLENWKFQYFSKLHYIIILIILPLGLILWYKDKTLNTQQASLIQIILISFIGCFMYSALMLKQFPVHDYYFLDTFYLPIIFLVLIVFSFIKANKKVNYLLFGFMCVLSVFMIKAAFLNQVKTREFNYWDKVPITYNAYKDAGKLLETLKVSKNAKIMAMYPIAPNLPFILMNRKGFAIQSTNYELIENALTWDFDYITVANSFLVSDVINEYPDFINKVEKVGGNNELSVYKLADTVNQTNLLTFLELNKTPPIVNEFISFDTIISEKWENTYFSDSISYSGKNAGFLNKENEYGITIRYNNLDTLAYLPKYILLNSLICADTLNKASIVISIDNSKGNMHYKSYNIKSFINDTIQWNKATVFHNLPPLNYKKATVSIFIWNRGKDSFLYDDFSISIY